MLVSILIPCYNAERWVAQAIESALAQTWPEKEIIVVDDGSTDSSLEIIRRFSGHVRWETGPNLGSNAARNRLLGLARGKWLQYLDADDYLLSNKVASQMAFVGANRDADLVFGPVTLEHHGAHEVRRELLPIPEPHDPWVLLARWYLPQTGALLWRHEAIVDVGRWKPDQPCCQEHELYLRLLMAGKQFRYSDSGGSIYRQWDEHTVCKRDKPEVRRRRLDVEQQAEVFLRQRGELTPARQWAINQARFEIARTAWQTDRAEAKLIATTIQQSQPDFIPSGAAAPRHYQALYRLMGFQATEVMAEWRRRTLGIPNTA
jgi:Glycosyl transferase family 2